MITGKITLSGKSGTGKGTVGELLTKRLEYDFISVGDYSREYAAERGMTIDEFQKYCKEHPEKDKEIDKKFADKCNNSTNLIVDWRLGFHFLNHSFNVYLKVSEEIAAKRIAGRSTQNEKKDFKSIMEKDNNMKERFIEVYGVDFTNESYYDLVINTGEMDSKQIVDKIISEYTKWSEQ